MLREGKLKENSLVRSVIKELNYGSKNQTTHVVAVGEDAAIISSGQQIIASSIDPVTINDSKAAYLAVNRALNNIYSQGARPISILLSVLLPSGSEESLLKDIIRQARKAADSVNVNISGGHTEVTKAVNNPIITASAIGIVNNKKPVNSSNVLPGDDIILTKWIGLEGTSVIVRNKKEDLKGRFSKSLIETAEKFGDYISISEEAIAAIDCGVSAMHDVSTGGIFGALWEFAQASGVGLDIDLMSIPVRQETIEICEVYGLNPYEMLSGGCLLIATAEGEKLVGILEKEDIPAVIIGKATDKEERILHNDDEIRYLDKPSADEILKLF